MTALVPYETGTISVEADGTAVVGVGPNWSSTNVRPGDRLDSGHFSALIVEVVDQTHLTITPWPGSTLSGAQYKIWPNYPQRVVGAEAMSTVNRLVADLSNRDIPVIVGADETEPDPSLGDDDQYADQPTTGKKWVKVGGVWTFIGIFKALRPRGAYDNDATYSSSDWVNSAGSSYVWINETPGSGHAPPNATYWDVLAARGTDGDDGAAATVAVGTVTTGAGGSAASVTNSGTSTAAVFDFTIPAGKSYGGTSTTSRTIGAGSQAFTTQAGLAYQDGARVRASSAANTSNWMEGVATYSGTTLTLNVDKTNGSGTLADWNFNVVGQPGAGDLSSANNLSDLSNKSTARDNLQVPQVYGQCRLSLVGADIVLLPVGGNVLTVNGVPCIIPDSGVSLAPTGFTPGGTWLIYATASGGVVNALEASTTAHVTSTTAGNKGNEIKSGDDSRTLVGMARIATGPAFADSGSRLFVLSWHNRMGKSGYGMITATRSVTSASWVEFNTEIRVEFLTWSDELVDASVVASGYVGAANQAVFFALAFDGSPENGMSAISDGSSGALRPLSCAASRRLSEGYHYATIIGGQNGAASANLYYASASNGLRSGLFVKIRG